MSRAAPIALRPGMILIRLEWYTHRPDGTRIRLVEKVRSSWRFVRVYSHSESEFANRTGERRLKDEIRAGRWLHLALMVPEGL